MGALTAAGEAGPGRRADTGEGSAPTAAPVPVLVLTGFLGAGKTSVLNHLLTGSGLRIAAVVNDFGEIEVDAMQVASRVDSVVSLANGCLCCEVDASDLADALTDLADPGHAIDLVVVEASGLAEPDVLARMVHDAPRESVAYAGTVQVVDAEQFEGTLAEHPRLSAHLAGADLVVVNKVDLVGRRGFDHVRDLVRTHAPRVAVVPSVRGAVPTGLLLGLAPVDHRHGHDGEHGHHDDHDDVQGCAHHNHGGDLGDHPHLHDGYVTVTARPTGPLHPRRLLATLSTAPAGTFRAKGRITIALADGPRRYDVALVGRRLELAAASGTAGRVGDDGVVLIGVDLESSASRFLDDAVLSPGETVDPDAGLGLQPYLVADPDASDVEEWIYDEQRSSPLTGESTMLADPEDPDTADPAFTP